MSGYRRVNFYELCRLCTSSEGTKTHIFREEGRRRQLPTKIRVCLPLQILEDDSLPKIVCNVCLDKIEEFTAFRQSAVDAEAMLETYFNSLRYSEEYKRSEGKVGNVYVKDSNLDISPVKSTPNTSPPMPVAKPADSVIQVLKSVDTTQTITSAATSTRSNINFFEAQTQNGQKSITLPLNVSQSPIKLTTINAAGNTMVYPVSVENLQNLVQAGASVQIVQQNESDGTTRLQSYRYVQLPTSQLAIVPSTDQRFNFVNQIDHQEVRPSSGSSMNHEDEHHEEPSQNEEESVDDIQYITYDAYSSKEHQREDRNNMANISEFLKIKTDDDTMTAPNNEEPQDGGGVDSNENLAMCGNCGKMLMSNEEMSQHIESCTSNVQTGVLVQSNNQNNENKQDKNNMMSGGDLDLPPNNYPCDICSKSFRRKEHLFQHKKLHTGERPFICGTCGKAFSRKEHLLRHGTSHTGQKMHPCDICGKMFSRKDNLHKHRKTHGICGPYVCDYCGKSFVVKHYYMMHIANHGCQESKQAAAASEDGTLPTPQFQYRCDVCFKSFGTPEFLKTHKSRHRNRKNVQVIQVTQNQVNPNQQTGGVQHAQQQQQQQQGHSGGRGRGRKVGPIIVESNSVILKQEICEEDIHQEHDEPMSDSDPLCTISTSNIIPNTMGAHVIHIPTSYIQQIPSSDHVDEHHHHQQEDGDDEQSSNLLEIVSQKISTTTTSTS